LQEDGDGWHAYIDGKETPVFKTNFLLRGLQIPEGDHEIVFQYQKKAFNKRGYVSRAFSGIIVLVGLGFLANSFFNRRKRMQVE